MGLASKIQASGRPPLAGAAPAGAPAQQGYGQSSAPPYPVQGNTPQQQQYGQSPQQPAMNTGTKPGAPSQGYAANQPPSNPFAQAQAGYGQGPPQAQQQQQQPYGHSAPPQAYGQPGQSAPGQYGQTQQGQYGQGQQATLGQQGYAAPQQGQAAQQGGGRASGSVIRENLTRIVRENQLEAFYPPQKLQQVIGRVEAINFQSLSSSWDIPMEIATDLAALALYDIVFYCDDSGSMRAEERGERIDDLKLILSRVSEVATMFDDDGVQIRFMNSEVQGNGIRSAAQAQQLVEQVRFSGITPLGTNLDKKVIQPLVLQPIRARTLQKPVLICVITDGEPVGEPRDLTRRVIAGAAQQAAQAGIAGALRFQFAQVGKDMKAQTFLGELDNDAQLGSLIDATSYFELEAMEMERKGVTLTPDLWLVKLCVGAIDKTYDEQDE